MAKNYKDLGVYSDLATVAQKAFKLYPTMKPGKKAQAQVKSWLGSDLGPAKALKVKVEKRWTKDGVDGELITYSVGFGPRTEAYYLRPAGVKGKLPGVVALHDHGGFKYYGKEKVAEGPDANPDIINKWYGKAYGGRPFANELARQGFAVLVNDCFSWGSRKFPLSEITEWDRMQGEALHAKSPMEPWPGTSMPADVSLYAWSAVTHEHTIQKYCHVLGTSMAGVMAYEDNIAVNYLLSRKDVKPGGVGCVGLSGGGLRSTLLQATSDKVKAAVVVGLMSSYPGLLDHNVVTHTWMMYPTPELARHADWPDLVACRAPSALFVQYDMEDALFTMAGMKEADKKIAALYKGVGKAKNYLGKFYPGPHKFDVQMQDDASKWLHEQLG